MKNEKTKLRPPFYGLKYLSRIEIEDLLPLIDKNALFKGRWGLKKGRMDEKKYEELWNYGENVLKDILSEYFFVFNLSAVYGYFRCKSEGNKITLFDENFKEMESFEFPRTKKGFCIADYFSSKDMDFVSLMAVTLGEKISEEEKKIFCKGEYEKYLYLHGLGVEIVEAGGEYVHRLIKKEIGGGDSCKRYSFGYPSCPNLEDQKKILRILDTEKLKITLSETFMLIPEQSITAIITH